MYTRKVKIDSTKYEIGVGTVQAYVCRQGNKDIPMFFQHFGRAEYDRDKPILSKGLKEKAQEVCNLLNSNEIDETEAKKRLEAIWYED